MLDVLFDHSRGGIQLSLLLDRDDEVNWLRGQVRKFSEFSGVIDLISTRDWGTARSCKYTEEENLHFRRNISGEFLKISAL